MKFQEVKDTVIKAVSQTLGSEYLEQSGLITATESFNIADVGKAVLDAGSVEPFTRALISVMAYMDIINNNFDKSIKSLEVDSFEWGGFIQRVYIDLLDIVDDPMYTLTNGVDYSSIEHKAYIPPTKAKIFEEGKPLMIPLTIQAETLKEAFTNWTTLNKYLTGIRSKQRDTMKIGRYVMEKMLVSCACAVSTSPNGLNNAVHLITDAKAEGIIPSTVTDYDDIIALGGDTHKRFLIYVAKTIANTRDQLEEFTKVYNNGEVPTGGPSKLLLISKFSKDFRFDAEANTFNDEKLAFGEYEELTSWQGLHDETNTKAFNLESVTTIHIAADSNNKLGIGTAAYKKSGIVGLAWQDKALGICLDRVKMTSNYTACADFWNEFLHVLMNYILDTNLGMVAFVLD